jgi:hypothetical protein
MRRQGDRPEALDGGNGMGTGFGEQAFTGGVP